MKKLLFLFLLAACSNSHEECPEGYVAVSKQTMITPSGVVTQPNEYGKLPPGTLKVGANICIRKAGVIEPRPAFENYGNVIGTLTPDYYAALKIWPLADDKILVLAGVESTGGTPSQDFVVVYPDGTSAFLANGGGPAATPGKTQIARTRERTFLVTEGNAPRVIVDSDIGSTAGSDVAHRAAGLPMPSYVDIDSIVDAPVLTDGNFISYRVVFRRTVGGYTFRGAVSAAYAYQNNTGVDATPRLTVYWNTDTPVRAGDALEVYRVDQQSDIDLLGDRYRYALSHTLTDTDIFNKLAVVVDTTSATNDDLYTNGEQDGASQSNFMPPPSVGVVTFKGATFYNATESWHQRTLRAKYLWGEMQGAAGQSSAVGYVEKTVTLTSGQPTVTAASVAGLEVGMEIESGFPSRTKINSISGSGPYTLTMSDNATTSGTADRIFYDVIEIDGTPIIAQTALVFAQQLAVNSLAGAFNVVGMPDRPLIVDTRFVTFTLIAPVSGAAPFTIRATHGDRYTPPLPNLSETAETSSADPRTNRLYFSKIDQPEAVGPLSYLTVGHGKILRLVATEQSLFAFCTDGIFQIVGDGDDWSVEPFDPDTILLAPDAVDTMDNRIFALTTAGFVEITEQGVEKISSPLIGDQIRTEWKHFNDDLPYTWAIQVACDKYRNEVWINFNGTTDDVSDYRKTFIWNTDTSTFTTQNEEQSIAVSYVPFLQSIVVAENNGASPLRLQLRKYSDDTYMSASLEFNPVTAEDVGYLKQWIDVTLFFETLSGTVNVTPNFEAVDYPAPYSLTAGDNFEHVVALLQDYAYNKHCRFGIDIDGDEHWSLLGLTYRYRTASPTLRA